MILYDSLTLALLKITSEQTALCGWRAHRKLIVGLDMVLSPIIVVGCGTRLKQRLDRLGLRISFPFCLWEGVFAFFVNILTVGILFKGSCMFLGVFLDSLFATDVGREKILDVHFLFIFWVAVKLSFAVANPSEVLVAHFLVILVCKALVIASVLRRSYELPRQARLFESELLGARVVSHLLFYFVEDDNESLLLAHLTQLHSPLDNVLLQPAVRDKSLSLVSYFLRPISRKLGHGTIYTD